MDIVVKMARFQIFHTLSNVVFYNLSLFFVHMVCTWPYK